MREITRLIPHQTFECPETGEKVLYKGTVYTIKVGGLGGEQSTALPLLWVDFEDTEGNKDRLDMVGFAECFFYSKEEGQEGQWLLRPEIAEELANQA
jgi:hypothetical protein